MRTIDVDYLYSKIQYVDYEGSMVFSDYVRWSDIEDALTVERPNCDIMQFGECSYNETGCSDCRIKQKIYKALERPKGKWEFVQYDANPNIGNWHCTNCRRTAKPHTDFCPNCGADMRGE